MFNFKIFVFFWFQGFRKVDWEFANDWFVRGRKELLKNVIRRKNVQSSDHQSKRASQKEESTCKEDDDTEKSELWKEVDILKGDKKALAQELFKVRQYQEVTDTKMLHLEDRVQGMEESQQEMLSFLVMVMQNPSLLVQLLQPKESSWRKAEGGATILEEVIDARRFELKWSSFSNIPAATTRGNSSKVKLD